MTEAIKAMYDLGFIDTTENHDGVIVRRFTRFNHLGYVADIINFIRNSRDGVDVFTNDLINRCGTRLDWDLLWAINLNVFELERK